MSDINKLKLLKAIDGLKNKQFTSTDLVSACYAQIDKLESNIKAFVTLTRELAFEQARKADQEISEKGDEAFEKKPLLGIPYACKDNYSTKGIQTTASSNILKGYIPPYESTVTQKIKDAGAILLGKTNMDAFAHGSSTETSDFFKTKNPWDYSRVPGGSSGGSAAAVVSNMCIFAIGSETAGSIRGPAAWCGISGVKPTYGRVSRYGVIAMASSTDSPGPLTKSFEDAALILKVIAGKDPMDATSSPVEVPDYLSKINRKDLKGIKVGKPRSYFNIDIEPGVKLAVEKSLEEMKNLGAQIVDIELLDPKYSIAVYTIIQRSEVSSNLARFDGIRFGQSRDAFGLEARKRMMLGAYALSAGYYDAYYSKAQKVRTLIVEDFNKSFEKVDVIVGPTMPSVAIKFGDSEKSTMFGEMMDVLTEPSAIAGLPSFSIPCGFSDNLPVGMQIIGRHLSEELLFNICNVFEQSASIERRTINNAS